MLALKRREVWRIRGEKCSIIDKVCARRWRYLHREAAARVIKPFEEIPGPRSFPVIGTLYKYLPVVGEYSFSKLHKSAEKKLKSYGALVKEEMVPGVPVVWVFKPEDIAEIFKAETGLHPMRRSHLALLKYRQDRSDIYSSGGLLPTNGNEWWRLRKEFQKVLSKPSNVVDYLEDTDLVIREFLSLCRDQSFQDFLPLLCRLLLELTCLTAFDVRMNGFSEKERRKDSTTTKLIEAAFVTNSAVLKLDNGPRLWRFFETPLYRKMRKAQNYMEAIAMEMVTRKRRDTTVRRKESLLEAFSSNPALNHKDIIGIACDMLLAGVDTTTYSIAFALYHLARNPRCKERLRSESKTLLPHKEDPVTASVLQKAVYTKAVLKETFRLNPISIGVGRILQTDVVLSGYNVPKGTVVVTQNQVTCRLSEYFDDPDSFIPERWLRENGGRAYHPYLVLPFGHGPRSCIARRFAEQNIQTFLLRLCREQSFVWRGGDLDCTSLLINKPTGPLQLDFYKNEENTEKECKSE